MKQVRVDSKRDYRHYISLSNFEHVKMKKLAISCNMRPSELSYFCLRYVLHNPKFTRQFYELVTIWKTQGRKSPGGGGARVAHHYISLDQQLNDRLIEESWRAGIKPATYHYFVIRYCLRNPAFINFMQEEYNIDEDYRVVPIILNGEVYFQ